VSTLEGGVGQVVHPSPVDFFHGDFVDRDSGVPDTQKGNLSPPLINTHTDNDVPESGIIAIEILILYGVVRFSGLLDPESLMRVMGDQVSEVYHVRASSNSEHSGRNGGRLERQGDTGRLRLIWGRLLVSVPCHRHGTDTIRHRQENILQGDVLRPQCAILHGTKGQSATYGR
jgi:hypothetical protein